MCLNKNNPPFGICCTFLVFGLQLSKQCKKKTTTPKHVWVSLKIEEVIHWQLPELSVPYILVCRGTSFWFLIPAEQTCELWWQSWSEGLCIHHILSRNPLCSSVAALNPWSGGTSFMGKINMVKMWHWFKLQPGQVCSITAWQKVEANDHAVLVILHIPLPNKQFLT